MSDLEEEYYCPNCGAILNDQDGFDPDDGYWICKECSQPLFDEEDEYAQYGDVVWCCDNCGAILNSQSGFSDYLDSWTCEECGYLNSISDDEIYESEEDWRKNKKESNNISSENDISDDSSFYSDEDGRCNLFDCDEEEDEDEELYGADDKDSDHHQEDQRSHNSFSSSKKSELEIIKEIEGSKSSLKETLVIIGSIFILLGALAIPCLNYEFGFLDSVFHAEEIKVPFSSDDFDGKNIEEVKARITDAGFSNIEIYEMKDLNFLSGLFIPEGEVESVSIAGDSDYQEGDYFKPDCHVLISVHSLS